MISNERLIEIIAALCTDCLHDYEEVFDSIKNGEIGDMAKELLALRKTLSVTAVYEAEINGVMSSVTKSHYEDCKKYGVKTRELIVKPTPEQE